MKKIFLLVSLVVIFIGCGGSSSPSPLPPKNNYTKRVLNSGESDILKKGDKVKVLTEDTKLNIVTNSETLENNVTVIQGSAEVTKYN